MEQDTRPGMAELQEHLKAGKTLRQLAEIYGKSTKTIKRWCLYYELTWRKERRYEDTWERLLAGGRFEDDPRATTRRLAA